MTGMLASVGTVSEAAIVLDSGADIIDLKNPANGALGAVDHATARDVVKYIDGCCLVSATVGDLPMQPDLIRQEVTAMAETGVDFIKIGIFADYLPETFLALLNQFSASDISIVLVLFADRHPDLEYFFNQIRQTRIRGVMLDTAEKSSGSLTDIVALSFIEDFLFRARESRLITGLAGSLTERVVSSLLALAPDYLGFRGALCKLNNRINHIDPVSVRRIRSYFPEQGVFTTHTIGNTFPDINVR